jgi:hypothetical protein
MALDPPHAAMAIHPAAQVMVALDDDGRFDADDAQPEDRRCGRCRELFTTDPDLPASVRAEWWLCPPCRELLLGRRAGRGDRR